MVDDVTDTERAQMVLLNGLNYSGEEIADELGLAQSTVYRHVNLIEKEAKSGDPERVFWETVTADLFDGDFRGELAETLAPEVLDG